MIGATRQVMFGPIRCVGCGARAGWLCAACAASAPAARRGVVIKDVNRTYVPWSYAGAPRSLVLALKLRSMKTASEPLVRLMVGCCRAHRVDADVVTWVPARARDRARRGFDHAEVLARGVAGELGLPALPLLQRRGHQRDQAQLDRHQRRANLTAAFVAVPLRRERVLLVDDLVTTGATAEACAGALKAAGAGRIELLVACRA